MNNLATLVLCISLLAINSQISAMYHPENVKLKYTYLPLKGAIDSGDLREAQEKQAKLCIAIMKNDYAEVKRILKNR